MKKGIYKVNNKTKESSKRLKVVVERFSRGEWREKTTDLMDIYAIISSKKYQKQVQLLRDELIADATASSLADMEDVRELPIVHLPTGMVLLSLPTDSQQQLELLRKRVATWPQMLMAFQSVDGRHLVVLMSYELTDGTLPFLEQDVRLFQQYALRRAADFVVATTGVKPDEDDAENGQWFYVSSDERALWNEQTTAVQMEQPTEELTELTATIMSQPKEHPLAKNVLPGYTQLEMDITRFNAVCRRLAFGRHKPIDEYLLAVAEACNRAGIDQEVATKCLLNIGNYWDKEPLVRSTMENAYQQHRYFAPLRVPQECGNGRRGISGEGTLHSELATADPGGTQRHKQCRH